MEMKSIFGSPLKETKTKGAIKQTLLVCPNCYVQWSKLLSVGMEITWNVQMVPQNGGFQKTIARHMCLVRMFNLRGL